MAAVGVSSPPPPGLTPKGSPTRMREERGEVRCFADIELRLDLLSEKVEDCLAEILRLQIGAHHRTPSGSISSTTPSSRLAGLRGSVSTLGMLDVMPAVASKSMPALPALGTPRQSTDATSYGSGRLSSVDAPLNGTSRASMDSVFYGADRGSVVSAAESREYQALRTTRHSRLSNASSRLGSRLSRAEVARSSRSRKVMPVRRVDFKVAWHISDDSQKPATEEAEAHIVSPMMRLVKRTRSEYVWELLDDPESSRLAWWISFLFKVMTVFSVIISNLQIWEEPILDTGLAAALETIFDSVYITEFGARLFTAPSRYAFILDPYNWADLLSTTALFFRAGIGFVIQRPPSSTEERNVQVILLFIVPVVRLLKLLRYFDSFRLLVDACRNSFASLPVMVYTMALILLVAANAIYLAEERSNIPSLPHSHWLALVTMTTVGFGDFTPKTAWGFVFVGMLSLISTCFVAMPVGIIGREFSHCWETRNYVLLLTRMRKCLWKWGFGAKDLAVLFEYVDIDGDGVLSLHEFIELIHQLRIGMTVETATELFNLFDDNGNGTIDYFEFLRHIFPDENLEDEDENKKKIRESSRRVTDALGLLKEDGAKLWGTSSVISGSHCAPIAETEETESEHST
ncbi:unnamed protein product [Durusdinium trenchii]